MEALRFFFHYIPPLDLIIWCTVHGARFGRLIPIFAFNADLIAHITFNDYIFSVQGKQRWTLHQWVNFYINLNSISFLSEIKDTNFSFTDEEI